MRIILKGEDKNLLIQLHDAVHKLREEGKEINHIELTQVEFDQFKKECPNAYFMPAEFKGKKESIAWFLGYPVEIVGG